MKVKFREYEPNMLSQKNTPHPRNCKRITMCVIYSDEFNKDGHVVGSNMFVGFAHCGKKDTFNQFVGKSISLKRALARMGTAGGLIPTDEVKKLLKTFKDKIEADALQAD